MGERARGTRVLADAAINTPSPRFDNPFSCTSFSAALEVLAALPRKDTLRVKAIVNVEDRP
jgi:hypothetical protein